MMARLTSHVTPRSRKRKRKRKRKTKREKENENENENERKRKRKRKRKRREKEKEKEKEKEGERERTEGEGERERKKGEREREKKTDNMVREVSRNTTYSMRYSRYQSLWQRGRESAASSNVRTPRGLGNYNALDCRSEAMMTHTSTGPATPMDAKTHARWDLFRDGEWFDTHASEAILWIIQEMIVAVGNTLRRISNMVSADLLCVPLARHNTHKHTAATQQGGMFSRFTVFRWCQHRPIFPKTRPFPHLCSASVITSGHARTWEVHQWAGRERQRDRETGRQRDGETERQIQ